MNSWEELPIFDIILIRNVLFYFEPDRQRQIINQLKDHMHEDSYLFLSAGEHPIDTKFFNLRSTEKDACFQLKSAAELAEAKIEEERAKIEARIDTATSHEDIEDLDVESTDELDLIENVERDTDHNL